MDDTHIHTSEPRLPTVLAATATTKVTAITKPKLIRLTGTLYTNGMASSKGIKKSSF